MAVTTSIGPGATNMITGHGADMLVADAREALTGLAAAIAGWEVDEAYRQRAVDLDADWQKVADECYHRDNTPFPAQTEVFGDLNELIGPDPPGSSWWDVPVSEVSGLESTRRAYAEHVAAKRTQRAYL